MSHRVKKVEWLCEYKLKLQFSDGKIKKIDLADDLKKAKNMFLDLVDINYFKQVKCDGFSIVWPNGIDYCPDVLYEIGKDVNPLRRKRKRTSPVVRRRKRSKSYK